MKGNYWKDLPMWAKGVIAVVVIGGVVFVGAKIYGLLKRTDDEKQGKAEKETTNEAEKELQDELDKGVSLSHPQSVYSSTANLIKNELDGLDSEWAEQSVVKEVLLVAKNQADWLALVKAFGVREIDNAFWGTGSTPYSLPTLLKEQLGQYNVLSLSTNYEYLRRELAKRNVKI